MKNITKKHQLSTSINSVIRILIYADLLLVGGYGLMAPIFAVFVVQNIEGGSLEVAGIAAAIYLLTRSVFMIPLSIIIDKVKGEKDDFWMMFFGALLHSFAVLLYIFIRTPFELYLVQFIYGVGVAMSIPTWYAIFTRHIDKEKAGFEWGVYQTVIDLGAALTAALGGFVSSRYGFNALFQIVAVTSISGSLLLLFVYPKMKSGGIFSK